MQKGALSQRTVRNSSQKFETTRDRISIESLLQVWEYSEMLENRWWDGDGEAQLVTGILQKLHINKQLIRLEMRRSTLSFCICFMLLLELLKL